MAISFNNIPNTIRTPGVYVEVDNSRALKGLLANPYKVLIVGQMIESGAGAGSAVKSALYSISQDGLADGYFGAGSILARMCNTFKDNNQNTELYAFAISNPTGVPASAVLHFSIGLSGATCWNSVLSDCTVYMFINGKEYQHALTSGWSVKDINSSIQSTFSTATYSDLPCKVSTNATSALNLIAVQSGTQGNYLDVRFNFYDGQSFPTGFGDSVLVSNFGVGGVGTGSPTVSDAWSILEDDQFHIIVNPYVDATNLASIENELADRFKPLEDIWGHCFTAVRGTAASCTTLGNSRNSPHLTIIGEYDSPTSPEEWAAAWAAVAAEKLNDDPSRPLQFLSLRNVVASPKANRFTRAERDILLYDGIATWVCDTSGNAMIERSITTYKANAIGLPDYSYLDVETLATLAEIRFQYKTRMVTRFITPRYKLADDSFPVTPGAYVVTPKTIRQETIALFSLLRDKGLIENLEDFIKNLVVERDASDVNRVNVLLPPDLINQFRVLAGVIQFIL